VHDQGSSLPRQSPSKPRRDKRARRKPGRPQAQGSKRVGSDTIVLEVCELLREFAPRDVTLLRVAEHAGVDRSLIRYYFKNRSSLLLAAARHLFTELQCGLEAAGQGAPADPEAQIRANAVALLRFQLEHPYFHRLMIDEIFVSDEPEAKAFFESLTSVAVAALRGTTRAAAREGETRAVDGAFLYIAMIGMCEFFVMGAPILKVAFGKDYDAAAVAGEYEKFVRDYVVDGLRKR
jgi:TetR/AcrR family transcriptional regulator